MKEDLFQLFAALRGVLPERHLERRCLVHHLPLEEREDKLMCPSGEHPTPEELAMQRGAVYCAGVFQWEVYDVDTGEVACVVMGAFRVDWKVEAVEVGADLAGRDHSGIASGLQSRPKTGRWKTETQKRPRQHRAQPRDRRQGRRATAA